jgi:hypothetical protein
MFIAALLTIAKPSYGNNPDEWIKGMGKLMNESKKCEINDVTHTSIFCSAIRKNEIIWFEGKWMQLEDTILSEVSQAQKDKGHKFSLVCGRQT